MTSVTAIRCPTILADSRMAECRTPEDFLIPADLPAARRPVCTQARSAASITEASRIHLPLVDARASAGAQMAEASTAEGGSMVVVVEVTGEHDIRCRVRSIAGEGEGKHA
jgi:hypothetical protein